METCVVDGCNKKIKIKSRGLCSAHYSQLRRTGSPTGSLKDTNSIIINGFIPKQPIKGCLIEECEKDHFCKGYCSFHYQRWTDYGDPNPPHMLSAEEKRVKNLCSKCGVNFRILTHSWCQPCLNESTRKWNASEAGPRWRRYKLKKSDVEAKKQAQNNSCVICGSSFDEVKDHVDHDTRCCGKETVHNGGTCGNCVRDLLCGSCNQGLGNFKDDPNRLVAAISYLKKWGIE